MKPDINSVEVHLQLSHNRPALVSALLDAALLRWNCSTNESHNGDPVDGTLAGAGWFWPTES
jgi:hypothetical protein